ncbi:MAG: hypothetical protein AABN34_26425 [Acidobacteriota bacterium]
MSVRGLRERADSWCLVSAAVTLLFLANYVLLFPYFFRSLGYGFLAVLTLLSAVLSGLLGLAALPRWRSLIALAIGLLVLWWLLIGNTMGRISD